MVNKVLFTAILIVLINFVLPAQEKISESEFEKAVRLYETEMYDDALTIFNQMLNDPNYKSAREPATVFKSKILIEKKKYYESEKLLKEFLKSSPGKKYRDEARLTLAKNLFDQSFYYAAFKELLILMSETESELYRTDANKYSESIAMNFIDPVQIKPIADTSVARIKPFLLLLTGKLFSLQNRIKDAEKMFEQIIHEYPTSRESEIARTFISENKVTNSGEVVVAVLLPLSRKEKEGSSSTLAWEVLEGIKYATDEFNSLRENKIGLIVRSTLEKNEIKNICDELDENESVKIVIGPIFSDEVKVVLSRLKKSNLPVVSPTATDDELISISNNFYQANPNFSQRGKVIANYIFSVENKKRIAVINSIEGYSPIIASAFVEEFSRLGGKVLFRETYKYNAGINSTGKLLEFRNSIDGIFVPLSDKTEASYILSQLVQNEIDLPLYGNQDWMQAKGFETSTSISNKLIFTSDYFIEFNDPDYQNFSREFFNKTKMEVNRNVLYGYDAAKYILSVIENTMPDRNRVRSKMESGIKIPGYHNTISFDSERINRNLNIVKYSNGIFELVERYELK